MVFLSMQMCVEGFTLPARCQLQVFKKMTFLGLRACLDQAIQAALVFCPAADFLDWRGGQGLSGRERLNCHIGPHLETHV